MSGDTRTDRDTLAEALPCTCGLDQGRNYGSRRHWSTCPAARRDAVRALLAAAEARGAAQAAAVEAVLDVWADEVPIPAAVLLDLRAARADPGQALAAHDAQVKAEALRWAARYVNMADAVPAKHRVALSDRLYYQADRAEAGGPDDG